MPFPHSVFHGVYYGVPCDEYALANPLIPEVLGVCAVGQKYRSESLSVSSLFISSGNGNICRMSEAPLHVADINLRVESRKSASERIGSVSVNKYEIGGGVPENTARPFSAFVVMVCSV
jgi:hypothetical protein